VRTRHLAARADLVQPRAAASTAICRENSSSSSNRDDSLVNAEV